MKNNWKWSLIFGDLFAPTHFWNLQEFSVPLCAETHLDRFKWELVSSMHALIYRSLLLKSQHYTRGEYLNFSLRNSDLTVWSSSALLDIFHGKELEAFRDTPRLFYLCPFIQQGKIQPMPYLGSLGYVKQIDSWLFRKGHGNWGTTAWIRLLKWSHHVLSNTAM